MTKQSYSLTAVCGTLGAVVAALGLFLAAGCTTTSPGGSKVTTFLTVTNYSLEEIRIASISVFKRNGYEAKTAFGRNLVFERYGGAGSALLYGTWMDPAVWYRVKLHIEEVAANEQVLECNIFRIRDRGDAILEEENRAYGKGKSTLDKILSQIKAELEGKTVRPEKP